MVFQNKNTPMKAKQTPKKGKKPVQEEPDDSDMSDFDFSDDSGDSSEGQVQKTPAMKTPKAKQPMSEKKVSFQMPGKSPASKTPQKNSSVLSTKQPTPAKGKAGVQNFKGMKAKNQKQVQSMDDDDDDEDEDDDDDDDDDFNLEMSAGDKDDDDDEDEDDDDDDDDEEEEDDDDDDDDEDDDEDEEDDEEEEEMSDAKMKKQNAQKPKQKTAKAENLKQISTPKAVAPLNGSKNATEDSSSSKQQNVAELYVGQLPTDVTAEEIKELSPDIVNVFIPKPRYENMKFQYAFVAFPSEAVAEANIKILQGKKLRGALFKVAKRNQKPSNQEQQQHDTTKLHVSSIPVNCTIVELATLFPKAFQISLSKPGDRRTATVCFPNKGECSEALENSKDAAIKGKKVNVSPYQMTKFQQLQKPFAQKRQFGGEQDGNSPKKMKFNRSRKQRGGAGKE